MNACQGHTTACTGADLRPVRFGLSRAVSVVCEGCRSTNLYQSAMVTERRVVAVPVAKDRRRFVPAWLRGLTAIDRTGLLR